MAKKNPFVFTIGFNKSNPSHVQVTEILNETEEKAQLIATAVLFYLEKKQEYGGTNLETAGLQPAIAEIVQREVKKALEVSLQSQRAFTDSQIDEEKPISLDGDSVAFNSDIAHNAKNALKAFRRF